jgi:hypothetical protein
MRSSITFVGPILSSFGNRGKRKGWVFHIVQQGVYLPLLYHDYKQAKESRATLLGSPHTHPINLQSTLKAIYEALLAAGQAGEKSDDKTPSET